MGARAITVTHPIADPGWTGPSLRIAILADLHVCDPWVPLASLPRLVAQVNALAPDLILLPGDFLVDRRLPARRVPAEPIVAALHGLAAPLGTFAVLGNHDWWDCPLAWKTQFQRNSVAEALAGSPIRLLMNESLALPGFHLAGTDSQRARRKLRRPGFDDAARAFAAIPEGAPTILLAHEPDLFATAPPRAFLQVSGHTHGGQGNLFGWRPKVPSSYGNRYAWGHIREGGRHLVVSGGIGYSGLPLRLFQPPEITLVTLAGRG
jgi:predicted MPP superfamily phosphohydrolase